MVLTPEQEQIGRQNFGGAVAVTRRDFLSGVTAGAAGIGALYFGYEAFVGDPVRTGFIGTGDEGNVLITEHPKDYMDIVAIADLRAAKAYQRTPLEDKVCHSCAASETLLSDSLELLSGHRIAVRFSDTTRGLLRPIYGDTRLDEAELELESVPWDLSPSVRQEPTLSPSYGTGDVAPGTLIHSGEMTMAATDVAIRGRGFDFAFTRTYRSGIVGGVSGGGA